MSDFNTDFIVSFLFTIYFIMMGFLYVYSVIKTSNKHKRKNKLFSFGLKIPRCIEKTYWQIFISSNYRCNHYKYHDDDEVCKYCLLLGYSLPFGEIMYNRAIDIMDKKLGDILKKISPSKYYNSEGICVRCHNYTKISRIRYYDIVYHLKDVICDNCLIIKECSFPKYIMKREIGLIK